MNPTTEETNSGTYKQPFTQQQYGVFTTKADGTVRFVASCVSADSALTKATLYYHKMNEHPQNDMDMSEIERFFVRVRTVTYSPWNESWSATAKEVAKEDNPWRNQHWKD